MKYFARIGDSERQIEFERRDGGLFARIGDRSVSIDLAMIGDGNAFSMLVDDRVFDVIVETEKRGLAVQMGGERHVVSVEDEHERAASAVHPAGAASGKQEIVAAMPGAVVEVMVEVGQAVAAGDTLLILEAMKMQNPVPAEGPGKVTKVHVAAGASVAAGDLLVEIDAE